MNISYQIYYIKSNIPLTIKYQEKVYIQGEVYVIIGEIYIRRYGYFLRFRKKYKKVDSDTDSSIPVLHPQELSKSSYR